MKINNTLTSFVESETFFRLMFLIKMKEEEEKKKELSL